MKGVLPVFTGIIEELGTVRSVEPKEGAIRLTILAEKIITDIKDGDSIAVNGICLTAVDIRQNQFSADATPETLRRSSLSHLRQRDQVNLERALRPVDRLGGHIVSGHIDGTGRISRITPEANAQILRFTAGTGLLKYIVEKGSVAVDGISLTVAGVDDDGFSISLIPHTAKMTTLGRARPGALVNIECDIIGKYVEKLLMIGKIPQQPEDSGISRESNLDWDFLDRNGF